MTRTDFMVLGGNGRVGLLLRRGLEPLRANGRVVVQARQPAAWIDCVADADDDGLVSLLEKNAPRALVVFWGVTPGGSADSFHENSALAVRALDIAARARCPHVVLMSSSAVYGAPAGETAISEDAALLPTNRYGAAKREMEDAARLWWGSAPLASRPALTILRLANVIGCDMLGTAISGATNDKPLVLDRFPDGQGPRRSYLSPSLLLASLCAIASDEGPDAPSVYNLADGQSPFEMGAILTAMSSAGRPVPWHWRPAPESAVPIVFLDTSRFAARFPSVFRSGCGTESDLVADYLNARDGV